MTRPEQPLRSCMFFCAIHSMFNHWTLLSFTRPVSMMYRIPGKVTNDFLPHASTSIGLQEASLAVNPTFPLAKVSLPDSQALNVFSKLSKTSLGK